MSTNPETPEKNTATPTDAAGMVGIPDRDLLGHADDSQTGETAERADTGTAHPTTDAPDLTFLSDDLQAALRDHPEMTASEFIAANRDHLERGYMRRDKFSRDKNALKAEQDELAMDREAAARYRALVRDPRVEEALRPILGGEQETAQTEDFEIPEGAEDWSAREILEFMQRREKVLVERAQKQTRDTVMGELRAPSQRIESFDHVANRYMEDNDIPVKTMEAAATLIMRDTALFNGMTEEMLPSALRFAVNQVEQAEKLKSMQDESRESAEKIQRARAASPRGQRGTAAPDKRSFSEENGRPFSADDQFDKLAKRMGHSESDLDRSLFRR